MTMAAVSMTLLEISRSLDRTVDRSTVGRWVRRGVLASNGCRVYLRARRLGGRLVVTREALEAFLAALNPAEAVAAPC
jgi:hypothetical protein